MLEGVIDRLSGGDALLSRYEEMVAVGKIRKPQEALK
jgi:hypothetical protein